MPAIADQVATIEHDLLVANSTVDSLRSENTQLKNALAALNVDHSALQAKHSDALSLVEETRMLADQAASAALALLKASRRAIGVAVSEGTKMLAAMTIDPETTKLLPAQAAINAAVAAAIEPEKTDVRPELPTVEEQEQDAGAANMLASDTPDQAGFSPEMQDALHADAEKLSAITGEDHSVTFLADTEMTNADRLRAHMPTSNEDAHGGPLPIFLTPRAVPGANVLG